MTDLWFVPNFLGSAQDDTQLSERENSRSRPLQKSSRGSATERSAKNVSKSLSSRPSKPANDRSPSSSRSPSRPPPSLSLASRSPSSRPPPIRKSSSKSPSSPATSRSPPSHPSLHQTMNQNYHSLDERSSRSVSRSSHSSARPAPRRINSKNAGEQQRKKSTSLKEFNVSDVPQFLVQKFHSESLPPCPRHALYSDKHKILGTPMDDNLNQSYTDRFNSETLHALNRSDSPMSQSRGRGEKQKDQAEPSSRLDTSLSSSPPRPPPLMNSPNKRSSFGVATPSKMLLYARKTLNLSSRKSEKEKVITQSGVLEEPSAQQLDIDEENDTVNTDNTDHLKRLVALRKSRNSEMLVIDTALVNEKKQKERRKEEIARLKSPIKPEKKRNSIKYSDWHYQSRPEIKRNDLRTVSVIDDRHDRRCVRCVVWDPESLFQNDDDENDMMFEMDDESSRKSTNKKNKRIKEKFALKISTRGPKDKYCKRVLNEKKIMTALDNQWHAKLVNTYISDNNLYMLLEYYPLGSLDQMVENKMRKKFSEKTIIFYTACILKGIEHMHKQGVIHRDIKLSNLLVDYEGYLKICDYGLSKFLPLGERTNTYLGTLQYIAPEMISKQSYSHIVDLWSLGICSYEMYYGITPFEPPKHIEYNGETEEDNDVLWRKEVENNILTNTIKFPDPRSSNFSLNLKLFIRSLLDKDVSSRLGYRVSSSPSSSSSSEVSYQDVQNHALFNKFSFSNLERRKITAPPPITS